MPKTHLDNFWQPGGVKQAKRVCKARRAGLPTGYTQDLKAELFDGVDLLPIEIGRRFPGSRSRAAGRPLTDANADSGALPNGRGANCSCRSLFLGAASYTTGLKFTALFFASLKDCLK